MDFFEHTDSGFYEEPSFLDVVSVVKWKKERGLYNFKSLPQTAIIVLNKTAIHRSSTPFKKKLKGLPGTNYVLNPAIVLCSEFGTGAPAVLVLLEELRVLGVKKFIFLGMAGIIDSNINENEALIISKAHSTVGSSTFYSVKSVLEPLDQEWSNRIKQNLKIGVGTGWSTDCPYRETPSMINYYQQKSVQLVDMECAAIYAFSAFHKLPSVCILIGADFLGGQEWRPPDKIHLLIRNQKKLVSELADMQHIL